MTFTALVVLMAGMLITYGLKPVPDSQLPVEQENGVHWRNPEALAGEVDETFPLPAAIVETALLNGIQGKTEVRLNGKETPVLSIPTCIERVVD